MIAYLEGKIFKKIPGYTVILANGVGYEVFIPLSTYENLKKEGETDSLFVYTFHKDDSFNLYGFKTEDERELFKILLTAPGVGPKLALSILSNIDVNTFKLAVANQDPKILTSIGGIGKKRAEKLIFELKEKFKSFYGPDYGGTIKTEFSEIQKDAIIALETLGYSRKEALETVIKIPIKEDTTVELLIKEALKELSRV